MHCAPAFVGSPLALQVPERLPQAQLGPWSPCLFCGFVPPSRWPLTHIPQREPLSSPVGAPPERHLLRGALPTDPHGRRVTQHSVAHRFSQNPRDDPRGTVFLLKHSEETGRRGGQWRVCVPLAELGSARQTWGVCWGLRLRHLLSQALHTLLTV